MEGAVLLERLVNIYETVLCHIFYSSAPKIIRMFKLRVEMGRVCSMYVTDIFGKKTVRKEPTCNA